MVNRKRIINRKKLELAAKYLKEKDPTRLTHYEPQRDITDTYSRMYRSIEEMKAYLVYEDNTKPYLQCEFAHGMGNSIGNLQDYWDVMESNEIFHGGYIWDWVDQAIETIDPKTGEKYFAYGGDWGDEEFTDKNFSANRLIFADRTVQPELIEVKKVFQNIGIKNSDLSKGKIYLENKYMFTNLKDYSGNWEVTENGKVIKSGKFEVDSSLYSPKTLPEIPEFSMITELNPKNNRVKWYGRGPEENYVDRKTGYDVGIYEENVEGLLVTSLPERETLEFNTLYYTPKELSSGKRHPFELDKNKNVVLRIIGKQMGVGGDNSWGARPHDQYQLKSGEVQRYTFKIVGKNKNIDLFEKRDNNLDIGSKNYFEARRAIEQVANNVVYLSDLGVKNSNKMTSKDKTIAKNPLTLRLENGEVIKFDKGINGLSDNDIIVNIEGKGFKKFQSYVGLDREVLGYRGTAEFKVFADGKEVFNSGIMKSSDRAKFIDIDLNGVKELKLQILNSDGVTKYDHGTYGDAKFVK